MRNHTLSRVVWSISLPVIFVEATETLDHLIATLFLARVGVTELGAIAVADSVMLLFLILPLALVEGIQILAARRYGQRQWQAVGTVFNQGLISVLVLSAVSTVALKLFSPVVAKWLVQSVSLGTAIDNYLQLEAYSIGLAGLTFAYSALLVSLGKTRALIPATLVVIGADAILNYLFIFGKFGCPALGMRGAAIGSIGGELGAAVFLTVYICRKLDTRRYGLFRLRRLDRRLTWLLGRLSGPIAGRLFLKDFRWFVFFLIVERMGASALGIANIVYSCYLVFCIPAEGFAEAVCSMVSRFVGQNRPHRIGQVLRSTTGGAVLATAPLILLAVLAPQWFVVIFSDRAELLAQGNASLRVVALAMFVAVPAYLWLTAVEGTGDTAGALTIDLLVTVVMLGMTYLAAIHLGWPLALVWLAVPVTWLVCLTLSYGWIKSGIWKRLDI